MDTTNEEYLVSTIKVEETELQCNGQESSENEIRTGFVERPFTANTTEVPGTAGSVSAILEHMTSTTVDISTGVQEVEALPSSGPSSLPQSSSAEIPQIMKRGSDMTKPEYRDFMVNSFTTLIGLTNKLCGIVARSFNPYSQVNQVHQVIPVMANAACQVTEFGHDNHVIPVTQTSQFEPTSQITRQDPITSPVNADSQVIANCVENGVNAEIPTDPLAVGEEIGGNYNVPSDGEMKESTLYSEVDSRLPATLKSIQPVTPIFDIIDDKEETGTAKRHAQPSTSQPPSKKQKLQTKPTTSAFSGRVCSYKIGNTEKHDDPAQFLNSIQKDIKKILKEELAKKNCIKVVLNLECKMKKAIENKNSIVSICKTSPTSMFRNSSIPNLLDDMFEKIMHEFSEKVPKGSGWTLEKICDLVVCVAKFTPLRGGTYIPTPSFLKYNRCVVNVPSNDEMCFKYSILAPLLNICNRRRIIYYQMLPHHVNFNGLPMPMPVECIPKFEQMNPTYSVNVYAIGDDETVHPIRVAESEKENHRDLLLLHSRNGKKYHYCCIISFSRFISGQVERNTNKGKTVQVCKKCMTPFCRKSKAFLEEHKKLCNANIHTIIKFPKKKNRAPVSKFVNFENSFRAPFVVYTDILNYRVSDLSPEDTMKFVPVSIACYTHTHLRKEHCGKVALGYKLFQGVDCVTQFVSHIERVTENISELYKRPPKDMDQISREKKLELSKQSVCHICDTEFKENDETTTNYDHLTGEIRGRAHSECDLKFQQHKVVPVIYQGVDKQILQNLICELGHGESDVEVNVENSETYISFQKKVGDIYIRFLDMFNFMSEDFEKLVKILPADKLKITNKEFHGRNVSLLKGNQVCLNEYIENIVHPNDDLSPSISSFSSKMLELKTSQAEHKHTSNVLREFEIKTLGGFCNHHLKSRVTLLADVFENFRSICFKHFNLDPCNYHTMQGITFDSALKLSRVELELLTEPDMFSMVEAGIRNDFVQVVTRYMKANNKNCVDYDHEKPMSHLLYCKANSIYATQMLEPLPICSFKIVGVHKFDSERIMNIKDDGELGYIFEVSLKYPHDLHDAHSDHPYCQELRTPPNKKLKLLFGTLEDKSHYVAHFRVLKQALENGLTLKKIHRVLQFKQSKWLKPVVEKITQLGRAAPDEFSKRFSEWALDSIHGKFFEDIRDKKSFSLVQTEDQLQKKINKFSFLDFHIYSENCVAMIHEPPKVTLDQPVYIGMTIKDLVKMQMNHFFYDVMKKQFGPRVTNCYEDSDTFILSVESDNIDAELLKIRKNFDFSNYPVGHLLHSESNKEKLGTFKNMAVSNPILSFACIRPKCYAIQQRDIADTIVLD